jgi:ferrous iron transport protein B
MSTSSERILIVGSPNSGKSSLFNRLTGLRQKVANYPGVTVEKTVGACVLPSGRRVEVLDLPGTYSLTPRAPDEAIVRDVLEGRLDAHEGDLVVAVVDATNLERQLYLALQILATGRPAILVLNLMDAAEASGLSIDVAELERLVGVPVLSVSARTGRGLESLRAALDRGSSGTTAAPLDPTQGYRVVEEIVARVTRRRARPDVVRARLDRVLTHRIAGPVIFLLLMAAVFQSIYAWATPAMDVLAAGFQALADGTRAVLPPGPLRSLVADGVIVGAGTVASFLPQLAILFFFIALLEDTGYMARAAFIMDRVMGSAGLPGRAFLPLLSSFACAIPGIMATRTIESRNDRFATILIAPFMACSARLPVYALLIGAFIPDRHWGIVSLQGLTLLALYLFGILAALAVGWLAKRTLLRGPRTLYVMELPPYRTPSWSSVVAAIRTRCLVFLQQAGTVIVAVSIVLWFLASYPGAPATPDAAAATHGRAPAPSASAGGHTPAVSPASRTLENSYAARLGHWIEPAIAPLGFDWKLGVGIISSIAARETMISTMATMYHLDGTADQSASLRQALPRAVDASGRRIYTPLVAVSLMVFFALAFQCMSTVAVVRRETASWRWPLFMLVFMNAMAWAASLAVYQGGRLLGWG